MSISYSTSQKLLRRATEDFEKPPEMHKSDSGLKKASTFPADLPLDIQLYSVDKTAYEKNPFLKARVKAYLEDLDKSSVALRLKKEESIRDTQAPLFSEERVTLKKINETRLSLNLNTADEIKRKFLDAAAKLKKN